MTTVRLYLTKVNLMLKSPLLPRFGDLVVAIVDDVLGQGLTLDRAYARHSPASNSNRKNRQGLPWSPAICCVASASIAP